MLVLSKQFHNLRIGSLRLGRPIATVVRPIINPHDLSVPALICEGKKLKDVTHILTTQDIRELRGGLAFIDDIQEIVPLEDVIRVRKIADLEFELNGMSVRTESGKKLGKVEDYAINTLNFLIEKIHIQRPLLRSLSSSSLIIHRNQIIEVNDQEVTVKDATVEDEDKVPATAAPAA